MIKHNSFIPKNISSDDYHLVYTDGCNIDFINLCNQLDDNLNEIVGGEKQRLQYIQYNSLADIHDVIVLYADEKPVGCASFKEYESGIAEIKRVFVHDAYRGLGLSKQLMHAIEQKAIQQCYKELILETGAVLVAAMGLYQSLGFHVIPNYGQYADMKESVCMRKHL
nr:GNAT family N-acetyltransferase [uncultured Anaerosporobacter sp.]